MRQGNYYVYRFHNEELGDCVNKFFLPDSDIKHLLNRLVSIADMKDKGYRAIALVRVDKETYLNLRLNDTVEDYLYEDRVEQETRRKYRLGQMSEEVFYQTMNSIKDYKLTCLKIMTGQVRRLTRNDMDVQNEIAIQLVDMYARLIGQI